MTIGERIKKRRKELGLTQEELANRLGNSSRASICTVEKDREDLTTTRIEKIAKALNTSPAYLMGWTDNPHTIDLSPMIALAVESYEKHLSEIGENVEEPSEHDIEEVEKAIDLYTQYRNAAPEIQSAIETLLKSQQRSS